VRRSNSSSISGDLRCGPPATLQALFRCVGLRRLQVHLHYRLGRGYVGDRRALYAGRTFAFLGLPAGELETSRSGDALGNGSTYEANGGGPHDDADGWSLRLLSCLVELAPFFEAGRVFHAMPAIRLKHFIRSAESAYALSPSLVVGFLDVGFGGQGGAVFAGINYPF